MNRVKDDSPHQPRSALKPSGSKVVSTEEAYAAVISNANRVIQYFWKSRKLGISEGQWIALNKIYRQGELSQSDLVHEIFHDRASVTRMLQSLEKKGLIKRKVDITHNRRLLILLTNAGRKKVEQLSRGAPELREKVYKGLSVQDLAELKRITGIVTKNILNLLGE